MGRRPRRSGSDQRPGTDQVEGSLVSGPGASGEPLERLRVESIWDMSSTADGRFAAAGSAGVALYGAITAARGAVALRVDSGLTSCSFASDGRRIAFGGSAGCTFGRG